MDKKKRPYRRRQGTVISDDQALQIAYDAASARMQSTGKKVFDKTDFTFAVTVFKKLLN